jgi:hypothetical protein
MARQVLQVRVWDLAFAVDVSPSALYGGATLGELWDARGRDVNRASMQDPRQTPARCCAI